MLTPETSTTRNSWLLEFPKSLTDNEAAYKSFRHRKQINDEQRSRHYLHPRLQHSDQHLLHCSLLQHRRLHQTGQVVSRRSSLLICMFISLSSAIIASFSRRESVLLKEIYHLHRLFSYYCKQHARSLSNSISKIFAERLHAYSVLAVLSSCHVVPTHYN